ncbi:MAG: hypothetical protein JSR86_15215 [Proteobacteria bacterium]|nr:hypothetical protein [Pseudomonadota bacterium]
MAGLLSLLSAPTLITSTVAAQGADAAYVLGTVIGVVGASSTLIIGLVWAFSISPTSSTGRPSAARRT